MKQSSNGDDQGKKNGGKDADEFFAQGKSEVLVE
jgi:hypothetical protein